MGGVWQSHTKKWKLASFFKALSNDADFDTEAAARAALVAAVMEAIYG